MYMYYIYVIYWIVYTLIFRIHEDNICNMLVFTIEITMPHSEYKEQGRQCACGLITNPLTTKARIYQIKKQYDMI